MSQVLVVLQDIGLAYLVITILLGLVDILNHHLDD